MKKILQVTTVASTLNAFLLPFAKAFKDHGWQVDAAAGNIFDYENVVTEHQQCFEIQFCRNPFKLIQLYRSLIQIRELLHQQKYDVVHVHTPIAAFITRIAAIGLKKTKVFYTVHGFHYISTNSTWKNGLFYFAEKLMGYRTDHLFVMNHDDYVFAKQKKIVPSSEITFIHGIGVNLDCYSFSEKNKQRVREELKLSDSTFMILQVAELNNNKNHQVVLQALSLLKRRDPICDILYVVVGEGSLRSRLEVQVKELGLLDSVVFLGQRNDISALLSACDALSLSSKREGLPRCMLEAMCVKKPIIASRIRGCTDLLTSGAGILVAYNDPEQWCNAMEQLCSFPDQSKQMGLTGYHLIQDEYQQNKIVDAVLKIYLNEFSV